MSIREDIKAYIDGELNQARAAEVRAALEADATLREEYEFMKSIGSTIKQSARTSSSKGEGAAVDRIKGGSPWRRILIWGGSGLGVVILLGVMFPVLFQAQVGGQSEAADMAVASAVEREAVDSAPAAQESTDSAAGISSREESLSDSFANRSADEFDRPDSESVTGSTGSVTSVPQGLRKVIRDGSMEIKVDDIRKSLADAEAMSKTLGGYVESSNLSTAGERPASNVRMRVPVERYEDAIIRLREYGVVLEETSSGRDVTAQHADLSGRLEILRIEEQQMVDRLNDARATSEKLQIRREIVRIRQEIGGLEEQRNTLQNLSTLSTLDVTFVDSEKPMAALQNPNWFGDTYETAYGWLLSLGRVLGKGLIFLTVLSPIWLPIGLLAWWVRRRMDPAMS